MSTHLTPQWQNEEGSEPVRIRTRSNAPSPVSTPSAHIPRAKRRPAAFVGIALFLLIGVTMAGGFQSLFGQVAGTPYLMRITKEGMSPQSLTVVPGATITWRNEDSIPHILSSDTLPTSDGTLYESSAMFPSASTRHLIPENAQPGTYDVYSKTAKNVIGQIIIQGIGASVVTPVSTPLNTTSDPETEAETELPPATPPASGLSQDSAIPLQGSIAIAEPTPVSSASSTSSVAQVAAAAGSDPVPFNPHNIASGESPIEPVHAGAPIEFGAKGFKPSSQPATGPAVWIVCFTSIAAFLLLTRKYFRPVA